MGQMNALLLDVAIATNRDPDHPQTIRDAQELIDSPLAFLLFRDWMARNRPAECGPGSIAGQPGDV